MGFYFWNELLGLLNVFLQPPIHDVVVVVVVVTVVVTVAVAVAVVVIATATATAISIFSSCHASPLVARVSILVRVLVLQSNLVLVYGVETHWLEHRIST